MHNGTIISTVTERAKASWIDPFDPVNQDEQWYAAWQAHWLATGEKWSEELKAEGLTKTAETLDKHLEWFRRNVVK